MYFSRITSISDERIPAAKLLYASSFPLYEQRLPEAQADILGLGEYHFDAIMDEHGFTGLMLYWENSKFIYVEHFCILPERRGAGCGKAALEILAEKGKTVILEIDPPNDEISIRRKGFYERAGYLANGYTHIHPPYRPGNSGHTLMVMSYPKSLSPEEYADFYTYLTSVVSIDRSAHA